MSEATIDRVWDKLLDITEAIGECKVAISTCASNIKAQAEIVALLAAHVKESNGNVAEVMRRLTSIELASACDNGERRGGRRQWAIIGGVIIVAAAVAGTAGTFIGLVIQ